MRPMLTETKLHYFYQFIGIEPLGRLD